MATVNEDDGDGRDHSNPVDESDVTGDERAEMLREYLEAFAAEFGAVPKLMPLDDEGKAPIIQGRCRLDSDESRELLVDGDEAVRRIREENARGFALYAGKPDHGTKNVVFVDHDDMAAFPTPTGDPTLEVLSGSGRGRHETYRNAGDVENAYLGDGNGEIRTYNLYVLVPGSIHPTGGVYHVVENREIATLSNGDLADHMKPASRSGSRNSGTDGTEEPCTTVKFDPEKVAVVREAIREFQQSADTTQRAMDYLMDLANGRYGKRGYADDHSGAEIDLASKIYGILRFSGVKRDVRDCIYSYIQHSCEANRTANGEVRKWLTRGDRYRVQHVITRAIETFVPELWDRWQHRRSGGYKKNGEYSSITFRYVLRAVHSAYEDRAGYPSKREVVDVAQGSDPDRSPETHERALRKLQNEHGLVKMAHCGGNRYVWYPASEPDPPNAELVRINGTESNSN